MDIKMTLDPKFDKIYEEFSKDIGGEQLLSLEGISGDKLDVGIMSHRFFNENVNAVSIDKNANSNESKTPAVYASEMNKGIMKLEGYYLLWLHACKQYGEEVAKDLIINMWNGSLKFHDPSGVKIQIPYCWAFSTDMIMLHGNPYGQLHDTAPKSANSFMAQVIEAIHRMSQEFAGATAPSDLMANLAYYAKKDNLTDKQVVNLFQGFVHSVNKPFRSGESPFTNVSIFDRPNMEKLFGDKVYPDGTSVDFDYLMHIQKIIGEWFSCGDPSTGLPYRFPVMTVNLMINKSNEIIDEDFLDWVSTVNIRKGSFNIYINDGAKLATCCRYSSDFEQMKFRADSFGNGGMNIGSHRVVTINLPRISHMSSSVVDGLRVGYQDEFYKHLDEALERAYKLLYVHRNGILKYRVEQGFLTFFSKPLNWFNLNQLFSTIGITGVYEMVELMGMDILEEEGEKFAYEVLTHIENKALEFSNRSGCSFNVEEIPGESTCVTLAEADKLMFNGEYKLYSNQYIPLIKDATLTQRAVTTGKFMGKLSGGGILHQNVKDDISPEQMKLMIRFHARVGVNHFAINFGFGICENGHTTKVGNDGKCLVCGGEIKDWLTRIIGYFTFVSSWSEARQIFDFVYRKFKPMAKENYNGK